VYQQQNGQTYHGGDGEVSLVHLLGQPVDLPTGVAKNDSLGNGQRFVQVAKSVLTPSFKTFLSSSMKLLK
jgi:hypothetical protein